PGRSLRPRRDARVHLVATLRSVRATARRRRRVEARSGLDAPPEDVGGGLGHVTSGHSAARLQPEIRVVVHAEPGTGGQPRVDVSELARVDPGSEDRLDLSFVLPPPAAELVDSAAGKRMELVQEDPDVIGVAMDHVEELVAEHGQLHRRRTAGLGYAPGAGAD